MIETRSILKCVALGAGVAAAVYFLTSRKASGGLSGIDSLVDRSKLSDEIALTLARAEAVAANVFGLKESEAVRLIKSNDLIPRLAWREEWPKGYPYAVTADLRLNRVNYRVRDGAVIEAWVT